MTATSYPFMALPPQSARSRFPRGRCLRIVRQEPSPSMIEIRSGASRARRQGEHMKAIVFEKTGGPEVMALKDTPKPEPRPGMVLIRTHAIGVHFADTRFRQGT